MSYVMHAVVALGFVVGCGGTGSKQADPKQAEKCAVKDKTNPAFEDGEACKKCCGDAGASGHMWMYSDGCKCL